MCGICGFNWEDKRLVKEMAATLSHRGPDQDGFYTDSFFSLGHKRLSIIDLTENGRQPMSNEDGTIWVVYNGEIYNFKEIKSGLKKRHTFKSNSDTEVIIHSYEEYGEDCVKLFNGMFAFALWDSINRKIILARDRLGIKPLFYHYKDKKFIFGSEIKSITRTNSVKKELNLHGLSQFITYAYCINGETMLKDIYELLPGHILTLNSEGVVIKKYWEVKTNVDYKSEDYFTKKLRIILKEAVKKTLVSDVPLGASLSGGIDSSSIVAFMSQIVDNPIKTFSIGFDDPSDELDKARIVADYCNTEHHEIIVPFKELTKNLVKIVWYMEGPFGRPSVFSGFFLSRGINRNGVIIDLAGDGSDELFAGYNRYDVYLYKAATRRSSIKGKANKITSGFFNTQLEKKIFFKDFLINNLDNNLKPATAFGTYLEKADKEELLNAALEFELKTELPGIQLIRADRTSMAYSHEVRVPFLDHHIVEFAMTIPSALKWNGNNKKYILQKAMRGMLPDEITNRVKLPFGMPLFRYFKEEFVEVADSILSKSQIFKKGLVKSEKVMELIQKIKREKEISDNSLRQVLFFTTLELSNELFIERERIKQSDLDISKFL
ncbi:MAG: asparagine synthase (glutamine-hydrolyzing) [Methanocellales archaeon]|nr:asparagine synthase (glutamine-hydrolyzing) [Methanocellales archaeon]MDD3291861.1 asparagine synthase (glutamine-hydrolyzing) [Methanocellales archaeon]MDD5235504.1 asparagine synthase (glutamine-hydrolyzing) [Methanocellales archaeon]MDD5485123.1 asparagine synthase (glutamine-hydrolyzing) [Methanocellales archaeon]